MAARPISLLLQQYNLPEEACSQQVSDVHLEMISRSHCKNWKRLPVYLELACTVASDIDRKQVEESEKRIEFFSGWKEQKGSAATYESLINALLTINCRQDAEYVCELLQVSSPAASSDHTSDFNSSTPTCSAGAVTYVIS